MLTNREVAFLSACQYEIRDWTQGVDPDEERVNFYDYADDPETLATYLTWDSLDLIETGCADRPGRPRTPLARMSVRAAMVQDGVPPIDDVYPGDVEENESTPEQPVDAIGCFESETRFAHSLSKQRRGRKESNPACVLFGVDGEPIAYQKGNGKPTALVHRDGYIATASGPQWVPENGIIRPIYEDGYDPRTLYADESLLVLRNPHIHSAHFLRFGVGSWLPQGIARRVLWQVAGQVEQKVRTSDIELAAGLSAEVLQQKLVPLLGKAKRLG